MHTAANALGDNRVAALSIQNPMSTPNFRSEIFFLKCITETLENLLAFILPLQLFRDLNDDALSSLPGDYTPSFRNSVGELAPTSPAASVMATAGSFCNDDMEAVSNIVAANEDLASPVRKEVNMATPQECDEREGHIIVTFFHFISFRF